MMLIKETLSYSLAKELENLVKLVLQKEGHDPKLYGIHSVRAVSTAGAAARRVPDRGWIAHRIIQE